MPTFLTNLLETDVFKYAHCTKCSHVYYNEDATYCNYCECDLVQGVSRHFVYSKGAIQTNRFGNMMISLGYLIVVVGQFLSDNSSDMQYLSYISNGTDDSYMRYMLHDWSSSQGGGILMALISAPFFYFGATKKRRAGQLSMRPASEALESDPRAPILYLRSFGRDRIRIHTSWNIFRKFLFGGAYDSSLLETFEEVFVKRLYAAGPVVAVCKPDESHRLPDIGAHRVAFVDHWQRGVEVLADEAAVIALVLDTSPGIAWELNLALQPRHRSKLIMVIPLLRTRSEERKYLSDYATLRQKVPELPEYHSALIAIDVDMDTQTLRPVLGYCVRPNAHARVRFIEELIGAKFLARLRIKGVSGYH